MEMLRGSPGEPEASEAPRGDTSRLAWPSGAKVPTKEHVQDDHASFAAPWCVQPRLRSGGSVRSAARVKDEPKRTKKEQARAPDS